MGNYRYTETDILNKSRELIHAFMSKKLLPFKELLDENFVWVGDYASQYIQGRDKFLETIAVEGSLPPVELSQEEYAILTHERHTWVTYGRFIVKTKDGNEVSLSSRIHFTFVWKQDKNTLRLLHANACHVSDEQIQEAENSEDTPQAMLFEHTNIENLSNEKKQKINIRDLSGNVHFLFLDEILYMKSDDKLVTVYTEHNSFTARTTLSELENAHFIRIHNSYLVNMKYITKICRYQATLFNGKQLPIGQTRYKNIQKRMTGKE